MVNIDWKDFPKSFGQFGRSTECMTEYFKTVNIQIKAFNVLDAPKDLGEEHFHVCLFKGESVKVEEYLSLTNERLLKSFYLKKDGLEELLEMFRTNPEEASTYYLLLAS